jgi:predicted component of type VI protein secretion system
MHPVFAEVATNQRPGTVVNRVNKSTILARKIIQVIFLCNILHIYTEVKVQIVQVRNQRITVSRSRVLPVSVAARFKA